MVNKRSLRINQMSSQKGEGIVKTKPDVKQENEPDVKSNKEHKPNIKLKHDIKMIRTKPDTNMITYEEEKVA